MINITLRYCNYKEIDQALWGSAALVPGESNAKVPYYNQIKIFN